MHRLLYKYSFDIRWVDILDSWNPGPTIWISACTHWWEVVWLDVIDKLCIDFELKKRLTRWKVALILTNIDAYKMYLYKKILSNEEEGLSPKDIIDCRFIEENLNRCCTEEKIEQWLTSETKRVRSLMPILKELDILFDIHSTSTPSESMSIITNKSRSLVLQNLNVDKHLCGVTQVQVWKPFIDVVERVWGIWIGIECWCQFDETGYKIWTENSIRLLRWIDMVEDSLDFISILGDKKENRLLMIKNANYRTSRDYRHLDIIKKWENIWFDWENELIAARDSLILMPKPKWADINKLIWEEWWFLATLN